MGYINPRDFFDAIELRAVVCTSNEGERFVEFYDRLNEENSVESFPAAFSRDDIVDGNANPYIFMLEEYEPKRYRVINRDALGMPIYQSIEEYTGLNDTYCVVNNTYVYIYSDESFVKRIKLEHALDTPSVRIVDSEYVTILIDDSETFASFDEYSFYRDMCKDESYDLVDEYDMYYQECDSPREAYEAVYDEFINK